MIIQFSRTTLHIELHWGVLIRVYVCKLKRPRVDLLIHIIKTRTLSKYEHDFMAVAETIIVE